MSECLHVEKPFLDKLLGDYRERKEWLRKNGAGLNL